MASRDPLPADEPGMLDFTDVLQRFAEPKPAAPRPPLEHDAAPQPEAVDPTPAPARRSAPSPEPPATPAAADGSTTPAARPPEDRPQEPKRPLSPTRAMAVYLTQMRQLVTEASESRRAWVRQIGIMMQDARTRPMAMVSPAAGKIGATQMSAFGDIRAKLEALEPPPGCGDLQVLMRTWLERHIEVCQILVDFGRSGEVSKLKATQGLLADGRTDLQRFQAEYAKRVAALKRSVEAAKKRRKVKWPFGRPKAP